MKLMHQHWMNEVDLTFKKQGRGRHKMFTQHADSLFGLASIKLVSSLAHDKLIKIGYHRKYYKGVL